MEHSKKVSRAQENIHVQGKINEFFNRFQIGTLIVRIYGKRWDIEVFFKMAKQNLKLAKEIQCRDFDALIAHTRFVFMRYMFLSYQCRMETDDRSFGDLFYACCDEVKDISFIEALYRILSLTCERVRQINTHCEKTAAAFIDAIMDCALNCVSLSKNNVALANIQSRKLSYRSYLIGHCF